MINLKKYITKFSVPILLLAGSLAAGSQLTGCSKKSKQVLTEDHQTEAVSAADPVSGTHMIVDQIGEKVTVPDKINRVAVIGIYPIPAVFTVFMGSGTKLVGMPPACMSAAKNGLLGELFPEVLNVNTSFTTGDDLNIESLMALKPDVVLMRSESPQWKTQLESAGIPAISFSVSSWDYDILKTYDEWISLLGQLFPENSGKSEKVSAYSKKIYDRIQSRVKNIPDAQRKSVLFLFQYDDKRIITSGKHFFGQFWCSAVGAKNAAYDVEQDNAAPINMEQVYKWNPDVIVITNFTPTEPADLYGNKIGSNDWSVVNAVKNHQVYKMPLGVYRSFTPEPDTPLTLQWMAKTVYPEKFTDIDLKSETRSYYKNIFNIDISDKQIGAMYNPVSAAAGGMK